jgi:hypothetical protein
MRTEIAQTVTFGVDGDARGYQLHGWHPPETGFTWMDGVESALSLPCPDAPFGFFIEVHTLSCLAEGQSSQPLTISVNGTLIESLSPIVKETYGWYVPPLTEPASKLVITLSHPTPVTVGEREKRQLTIGLHWLRLSVLLEAGGRPTGRQSLMELPDEEAEARVAATYLTGLPLQDLVTRFESFGSDCEVGLMQRRCGTEPLGLFRFSTIYLPFALRAVENDFRGMGEKLDAALEDCDQEWMAREHGYLMRWHTFLHSKDATREQILSREQKKLAFLIRKMRSDITGSAKIFIVKNRDNPASMEQVIPLHLALNRSAPNWLLWVTPSDEEHPTGSVEEIQPRLLRGYIDHFMVTGVSNSESIPGWMAILTNAWLLRDTPPGRPWL